MIPELNQKYIEQAKLTAFRARNIDTIVEQYKSIAKSIDKNIVENKKEKLNKLCDLYNDYLYQLGSHVSAAVAGRSNYEHQTTDPIDKKLKKILDYVKLIEEELKVIYYQENKEEYKKREKQKKINRLISEVGYYQDINRSLFYKALVRLHDLDISTFIKVYDHMYAAGKISNNSKPARLYKKAKEVVKNDNLREFN